MTKSKQTIQQKTAKLNELVAWFDSEEFTLEAALDHFKQAEVLAAQLHLARRASSRLHLVFRHCLQTSALTIHRQTGLDWKPYDTVHYRR